MFLLMYSCRSIFCISYRCRTGKARFARLLVFQVLAVLFGAISGALLLFSGRIKGFYYRLRRRAQNTDADLVDETDDQIDDES